MKLTFIGADHEVTGSCHYLNAARKNILVDYGMEQGGNVYENAELPVSYAQIDYVLLTHAHIDHAGLLPFIYARGFRGKVVTTMATVDLCRIMLKDSAHIQEMEAEWKNRKARRAGEKEISPLYTLNDAAGVINLLEGYEYDEIVELNDDITLRFIDAGHLLGSASIEVWCREGEETRKIVFSGDIGNINKPLIRDPQYIRDADYVVMECTYGDRSHPRSEEHVEELAQIIQETLDRGGNVVLPAFAVGRTQELLFFLRKIKLDHMVTGHSDFQVYVDSPLAVEATTIFNKNVEDCFSEEALDLVHQGINPIGFPGLRMAITSDESKMINFDEQPKVIISASGMCEAGRIRHHLKHNLWRKDSTILFVGYQVPGTLGNSLLNGAKQVKLFGETIEVHAKIENLPGISGHADRNNLTKWIGAFETPPKKVFIVHGDDKVTENFAAHVHEVYGYDTYAPYSGDTFDLVTGEQIADGSRELIEKKKNGSSKASSNVFARLLAAGQRLLEVINKCEGLPNKELAKFADQINALCDKWSR